MNTKRNASNFSDTRDDSNSITIAAPSSEFDKSPLAEQATCAILPNESGVADDFEIRGDLHEAGTYAEKLLNADPIYRISRAKSKKAENKAEGFTYGIHRIIRPHVKGGMGQVHVAYDQFLKRQVALKELFPRATHEEWTVRRFIVEAEITAQLEHPGIVPVHSLGLDMNGNPYYTMKLLHGITFFEAIKEYHKKRMPSELKRLIRRFVSVCQTIGFAHKKGFIHRDLKPANIMLSENGETLVMDWGIAKSFLEENQQLNASPFDDVSPEEDKGELTMAGTIVGTPAFMAPEQAEPGGPNVGPQSDIYSLGGLLFFILSGRVAFQCRTGKETLTRLKNENVPRPTTICKDIPAGLEAICLKAMQRLPEHRYQTAEELAKDICNWLDDERISVYEDSWQDKLARWLRRNRQSSTRNAGLGISLLLLAALTGIFVDRHFFPTMAMPKNQIIQEEIDILEKKMALLHNENGHEAEMQQYDATIKTLKSRKIEMESPRRKNAR